MFSDNPKSSLFNDAFNLLHYRRRKLAERKIEDMPENKRLYGQYFTITNPFDTVAFYQWIEDHKDVFQDETIVEPFAGSNNIPAMILNADILQNEWECFDIAPSEKNKCSQFKIIQQDTIKNFPSGFKVCITNPPYLSKNSATRRNLEYPQTEYDDIYKLCLDKMLQNVPFVAAIIPETFINSGQFQERLEYVVSLTCKMFDDTECPVCLAMFGENATDDFTIYQMNENLGKYSELKKGIIVPKERYNWTINDKNGSIGIRCVDGTKGPSIEFVEGNTINSDRIKVSSRSLTRVSGLPNDVDLLRFLRKCNELLVKYRKNTKDIFLASFKGLRADNKYRRRLDFATAKAIMSAALWEIQHEKN